MTFSLPTIVSPVQNSFTEQFLTIEVLPQALFLEGWDITVVSDSCLGS